MSPHPESVQPVAGWKFAKYFPREVFKWVDRSHQRLMKAKWWMQKRAFDLLVYRISQLSCNGFVKKMREELYNRPSPKEEGQRENPLFTRRESYERILHEGRRFAFSAPPPCEFPYEFRINSIRAKKSFFNNIFPPIEKKFSSSHFENKLSLHFRE